MATVPAAVLTRWLRDHGHVATAPELSRLGLGPGAQARCVAAGRLVRVARGLFVDGAVPLTAELRLRAYTRAGGPGAVASHRSAGRLWGFLPRHPPVPELIVPPPRQLRLPGVRSHRADLAGTWVYREGIPVTTAARTIVDLASLPRIGDGVLTAAVDRALLDGTTSVARLVDAATGRRGRGVRGGPRVQGVLEDLGHVGMPDGSVLERHLRGVLDDLCRRHRLPPVVPELPVCDGRYRLDFAWPHVKLAVEADGYAWHATAAQMGRDRWRRNALANAGWTVLCFTWAQIRRHPHDVAEQILGAYRLAAA